jgi:hypothetical protein
VDGFDVQQDLELFEFEIKQESGKSKKIQI